MSDHRHGKSLWRLALSVMFFTLYFGFLRVAYAAEITTCNSTVTVRGGDSVVLQNCTATPLLLQMLPGPCENISIDLRNVTSLEGIDWSTCKTTLRNIRISVKNSAVQHGGVLNTFKTQIERVENVDVDLRNLTVNLSAPSQLWSPPPTLVHIALSWDLNVTSAFNVWIRVMLCTVTSRVVTTEFDSSVVALTGTNGSVVRNVTILIDRTTVDVQDNAILNNTMVRMLSLSVETAKSVVVEWKRSSIHLLLPSSADQQEMMRISAEAVESRASAEQWPDIHVTVVDVAMELAAPASSARCLRIMRALLVNSSITMQRVQSTMRTQGSFNALLDVDRLTGCSVWLQDCSLNLFWNGTNASYAKLVTIGNLLQSTLVMGNVSATVGATMRSVDLSTPSFTFDLFFSSSTVLSTIQMHTSMVAIRVAASDTFIIVSTCSTLSILALESCSIFLNNTQLRAVAGTSNVAQFATLAFSLMLLAHSRNSTISIAWSSVTAVVEQGFTIPNLIGSVSIATTPPGFGTTQLVNVGLDVTDCRVDASALFLIIEAVSYRSVSFSNASVYLTRVTLTIVPLANARDGTSHAAALVGLASGCDCLGASSIGLAVTLEDCNALNDTAVIAVDSSSLSKGSCELDVVMRRMTSAAACPPPNAGSGARPAAVVLPDAAQLKSARWTLEDSRVGRCFLLSPAARTSAWWAESTLTLNGCNTVGGRNVTRRSLGAPWEAVRALNATCGLAPSVTPSVTVSDVLLPVRASRLGMDLWQSGALGTAVAANAATQWFSGMAVQRMAGVVAVAACAGDAALYEPMDAGSSPLQLALGDERGRYARGTVVGNTVLCVCAGLAGVLILGVEWRRQLPGKRRVMVAAASSGMPAAVVVPICGVLLPPTATASVSLLWVGDDVALGCAGLVACVAVLLGVCRLLCVGGKRFRARAVRVRRRRGDKANALSQLKTVLLRRAWAWRDAKRSDALHFSGVYGPLFDSCRNGAHWWAAVELTVGVGVSAACGLLLSDRAACDAVIGCVGAASVALVLLVLALRPLDTLLDTVQSLAANGLAALTAIVSLSNSDPTGDVAAALLWAQTAVALVSLGITLWGIVSELFDTGSTSHRGFRMIAHLWSECHKHLRPPMDDEASSSSGSSDEDYHRDGRGVRRLQPPTASAAGSRPYGIDSQHVQLNLTKLIVMACRESHRRSRRQDTAAEC